MQGGHARGTLPAEPQRPGNLGIHPSKRTLFTDRISIEKSTKVTTGKSAKKKTSKKLRKNRNKKSTKKSDKPKPKQTKGRKPSLPKRAPEEQREARRIYDQIRSQKPERKEAARLHAKKVRQERKSSGQCRGCSNQAIPGQTRCEVCRDKHNESRNQGAERKPRAPKLTPEERIEARREYERTRSQTPERKEAARLRAEKQRQERRAARLPPPE